MPEPQTWNVSRTGDGRALSWNGKPIKYRINWDRFSDEKRLIIRQVINDVCPRVGSGNTNLGQTALKPGSGWEVHDLATEANLIVYAKSYPDEGFLGYSNQHSVGDEYLGAVLVFNVRFFSHPIWGTLDAFRSIASHEMGHAVGLEHPTDTNQLMSPELTGLPWKFGDLDGFGVLKAAH